MEITIPVSNPELFMNSENKQTDNLFEKENSNENEKLPYQKPELINYGKVKNITKGGNSAFFDEGGTQPLV